MERLAIRLLRKGCANRPFYHIVVARVKDESTEPGIEQLGVYDPLPNERGEKLLALNVDRFKHYVAEGAWIRSSVAMLLGCAGVTPIHPDSYVLAWRNRQHQMEINAQNNPEKVTDESSQS